MKDKQLAALPETETLTLARSASTRKPGMAHVLQCLGRVVAIQLSRGFVSPGTLNIRFTAEDCR